MRHALAAALSIVMTHAACAEDAIKQEGDASFYGDDFQGHKTATGKPFNQNDMTAASKTLPLGSKAEIHNPETGKTIEVTVNDRGPYKRGRIIDLSKKAADVLDIKKQGVAPVVVIEKPTRQPTPDLKEKVEDKANTQTPN
jgi:rare lipoprotein A